MQHFILSLSLLLALSCPHLAVETDSCQFYLAESSIPHAGFGIYTVQPIEKGQFMLPEPDSFSIVITDVDRHNKGNDPNWNHINYVWAGEGFSEYESQSTWESVTSFGAMSNFHTYLYNIKPTAAPYDDSITPRSGASPGIGAYSYYGGYRFKAVKDIDAGDEIFAHYGESWLEGRPSLASAPLEKDFTVASDLVATVWKELGTNTTGTILYIPSFLYHTISYDSFIISIHLIALYGFR